MDLRRTIQALLIAERDPMVRQTGRTKTTLRSMMVYLIRNPGSRAVYLTHTADYAEMCTNTFFTICEASGLGEGLLHRGYREVTIEDKRGDPMKACKATFASISRGGQHVTIFEDHYRFEDRLHHLLVEFERMQPNMKTFEGLEDNAQR